MNEPENGQDASSAGTLLTRVPGRARPRAQVMADFEESVAELKRRYHSALWPVILPKPEEMHRWRIQLECGCTREVLTSGRDDFPDSRSWHDVLSGRPLPLGEYWCSNDHGDVEDVYRGIVEWIDSSVKEFPADPEECPEDEDPEYWTIARRPEPHSSAFWRVRLACGHFDDHVPTDVEWKPEKGAILVSEQRAAEMRGEFEALWSVLGDEAWPEEGPERDHTLRMLDQRWPKPEPERRCLVCRYAQRITGYQRIGWLVPRTDVKKAAEKRATAAREKAERRLAMIEEEAAQLREQLGRAEDQ